jgi:hypothetical protein
MHSVMSPLGVDVGTTKLPCRGNSPFTPSIAREWCGLSASRGAHGSRLVWCREDLRHILRRLWWCTKRVCVVHHFLPLPQNTPRAPNPVAPRACVRLACVHARCDGCGPFRVCDVRGAWLHVRMYLCASLCLLAFVRAQVRGVFPLDHDGECAPFVDVRPRLAAPPPPVPPPPLPTPPGPTPHRPPRRCCCLFCCIFSMRMGARARFGTQGAGRDRLLAGGERLCGHPRVHSDSWPASVVMGAPTPFAN